MATAINLRVASHSKSTNYLCCKNYFAAFVWGTTFHRNEHLRNYDDKKLIFNYLAKTILYLTALTLCRSNNPFSVDRLITNINKRLYALILHTNFSLNKNEIHYISISSVLQKY